ncbi:hypothetical protein GCM10023215_57190 [Pseudonocardia yuanmonensis]|uniref:Mycofactocin n=1 Tax=Pseudonocardia yuanmonensis TaxID=1095914 RepID=A0ABP8XL19_9PSEU
MRRRGAPGDRAGRAVASPNGGGTHHTLASGTRCQYRPSCRPARPTPLSPGRTRRFAMAPIEQSEQVEDAPVVEETLVEEVSIDGMCGVY